MKKISIDGVIPKEYRVVGNCFYSPPAFKGDHSWIFKLVETDNPSWIVARGVSEAKRSIFERRYSLDSNLDFTWSRGIEFYQATEEDLTLAILSQGTIWPKL